MMLAECRREVNATACNSARVWPLEIHIDVGELAFRQIVPPTQGGRRANPRFSNEATSHANRESDGISASKTPTSIADGHFKQAS
jgi:hypothetical protein